VSKRILDEFVAGYGNRGALALLFDYDGTLVPIAPLPRLARLSRSMRLLLQRLARFPSVALGIISGRALDELKDMVCLEHVCLAGVNGLELELGGRRFVHPRRPRQGARLRPWPGAWDVSCGTSTGPGLRTRG